MNKTIVKCVYNKQKKYWVGQNSVANFTIQYELILFNGYIHKVFFHIFSAIQYGHFVSHSEHPVRIPVRPTCEPVCSYCSKHKYTQKN